MICSKCGTQNDSNVQICKTCGMPLNVNEQPQQMNNIQNGQNDLFNNQPNFAQPMNNNQTQNVNNTPQQNNTMINNQPPIQNNFSQNANMNVTNQKKNKIPFIIIGVVIIAIVCIVFILKLFSTKTVTCTNTQNELGQTINQTVIAKFKNDKVDTAELLFEYNMSSSYVAYIDTVYDQLKQSFEQYKQKDGVDVDIRKENDKIVIDLKVTRKGLENLGEISLNNMDDSLDKYIEDMEGQGFTCKK